MPDDITTSLCNPLARQEPPTGVCPCKYHHNKNNMQGCEKKILIYIVWLYSLLLSNANTFLSLYFLFSEKILSDCVQVDYNSCTDGAVF
jgi:hypothetical protein